MLDDLLNTPNIGLPIPIQKINKVRISELRSTVPTAKVIVCEELQTNSLVIVNSYKPISRTFDLATNE